MRPKSGFSTASVRRAWRIALTVLTLPELFLLPPSASRAADLGCGSSITQDTVLDADISCPVGASGLIIVSASDIGLDLNGHTISGVLDPTRPSGSVGVLVLSGTRITIKNGQVSGFNVGILLSRAFGSTGTNASIIKDVVASNNASSGITIANGSNANTVKSCTLSNNINPLNPAGGAGLIINDNSNANVVKDCALFGNRVGLFAGGAVTPQPPLPPIVGAPSSANEIKDNRFENNRLAGIVLSNGDTNQVKANVVTGSGNNGIVVVNGSDANRFVDNAVSASGLNGLLVAAGTGPILPGPEPEGNVFVANNLSGNDRSGTDALDIRDFTSGDQTAGTRNVYQLNVCATSSPTGLCTGP